MDTPQEVQVWYILPALRKHLTLALKEERMKQKDIAQSLGLTEAAVSQYLKKKRGGEISFNKEILNEIKKSAKTISHNKNNARAEIQQIMKRIEQTKFICSICHS